VDRDRYLDGGTRTDSGARLPALGEPGLIVAGPVGWVNVAESGQSASQAEAQWLASQRRWVGGWRRVLLAAIPLVYLIWVAGSVRQNSHGAAQVAGFALLVVFAGWWLAAPVLFGQGTPLRWFWPYYAVLAALFVAELPFARAAGFVLCIFLTVLTVIRLGVRSAPVVAGFALAALLVPVAIPSWHVSLVQSFDDVTPIGIPIAGILVFAMLEVMRGNLALAAARAEVGRLAAENERMRIARDLHDILGHSLTTITVKAGLARRLGATDPTRAVDQITEVEELSRQALADVRAAVSSYRDVTLVGELARGRELLRASGIAAELPTATDVVDPARSELLGWAVREGLTNVVRHAHASTCTVRLSPHGVEITDDGVGTSASAGNGLQGLRERVAAAGGSIDAGPMQPSGWRLQVSLAADGAA
jgi:two-component system, NarL family, sensor histidine kinase DesK